MNTKKKVFSIILAAAILGWLLNLFFGRPLTAKISTWPVLNRLGILAPQAPIVMTTRETVRVSDSGDVMQAAANVKSKLSSVIFKEANGITVAGSAVNLTGDGVFVTSSAVFSKTAGEYFVELSDGRVAQITARVSDPATSLVFFRAAINGVPTAAVANSKDLSAGEKVVFVSNSAQSFVAKAAQGSVNSIQADILGQVLNSDMPKRGFQIQSSAALVNGQVVVNTNGEVVGLWSTPNLISSDVLRQAMSLYFGNSQKIVRPRFGFSYSLVSLVESKLRSVPEGAVVKEAAFGSPAQTAGLKAGDIITKVDNEAVDETKPLEETLQRYKPTDVVNITVSRLNANLVLKLTVGELK